MTILIKDKNLCAERADITEETVCHCNIKQNAELIAKILDADAEFKVYDESKDPIIFVNHPFKGTCACGKTVWPHMDYCDKCGRSLKWKSGNELTEDELKDD